ncbi:MAG: ABC transporter ATP-binding protein [Candidatus Bathyarchaeota archaeon]|nr:MAG: ABC transporter ATP-binding protein [Candidatus Bathyarchaeota archaeon]
MALLEIKNLKTYYFTSKGPVKAVDDVTLNIRQGEIMGLVGESGCGKSTLGYSIINLIPPPGKIVGGNIYFHKEDLTQKNEEDLRKQIRWKRISMVFQGAMNALNPVMKVGEQIAEALYLHENAPKQKAMERVEDLFSMVGLEASRMDNYPFEFSGGMKQRAMIAMALVCNPEFMIADEPTTALDVTIQAQMIDLLRSLAEKLNLSLLIVSHDLSVIAESCNAVAIMYAGKIVESGDIVSLFKKPLHPYTQGLMDSIPSMEEAIKKELVSIPGAPPNLLNPPSGCRFHTRCPHVMDICRREEPPYLEAAKHHHVACYLVKKT